MARQQNDPRRNTPPSLSEMIDRMVANVKGIDDKRFQRFWNYKPIPKLIPWFRNTKRINAIIGANKGTKSMVSVWKAIAIYIGTIPPSIQGIYPCHIPINRPRHVRIILQDFSKALPETIMPFLLDEDEWGMLPRGWDNWNPMEHMFHGPDGSWLSIMAIDPKQKTDPNQLRGPMVDHTYIDEITTREAFTESLTRGATLNDGPRSVDLGFCPQEGFDWTYTDIYAKGYDTRTDEELPEEKKDPDMNVIRVSMYDNPSITAQTIDTYINTLHPWEVGYRVYGKYTARGNDPYFDIEQCVKWEREQRFSEGEPYVLDMIDVQPDEGVFSATLRKLEGVFSEVDQNVWRVWGKPTSGQKYLCIADTAEGNPNSDFQVCDVWNVTDRKKPHQDAQFRKRRIKPGTFIEECACMATLYGKCILAPEVNNTSGGTVRDRARNYENFYKRTKPSMETILDTEHLGWHTDQWNKPAGLEAAYGILQGWKMDDYCGINSRWTVDDMMSFQEKIERDEIKNVTKRVWGAKSGCFDDCVASMFIMAWIVKNQYDIIDAADIDPKKTEKEYESPLDKIGQSGIAGSSKRFGGLKKRVSLESLMQGRGSPNGRNADRNAPDKLGRVPR